MGNSGCGTSEDRIVAETRSGLVRGKMQLGVHAFLGIPYAASTGGSGRWASPRREAPWYDVRDAVEYGPMCPQIVEMDMGTTEMSEDCLSLNVWTPNLSSDASLPVMVWIPGGGYVFGAGSQPVYIGADLALNNVVVVTINYRVNAFGFLAHPDFTNGANFGLQDMIAALTWVQNSIGEFGGDPNNVTVFGLSAGASAVTHLASMPAANGLFHRVISMSGTSPGDYYVSEGLTSSWTQAAAIGQALQALVGAPDMDSFRAVDYETILAAAVSLGASYVPVMDGRYITTPPRTALKSLNSVDVMVGSLARDSIGVMPVAADSTQYTELLHRYFHDEWELAAQRYPADDPTAPQMSVLILTTAGFTEPARYVARQAAAQPGRVYRYYWTAVPDGSDGAYGAAHTVELGYVFGDATPKYGYSEKDAAFSDVVQKYWTSFAATGNPGGEGLTAWPQFVLGDEKLLLLDKDQIVVQQGVNEEDCDFFESIYPAVPVDNP